jgi:cysteine synthase
MKYADVFGLVGRTPAVKVKTGGLATTELYLKLEGTNPTGSIKDRSCLFMLQAAIEDGSLAPGKTIIDASSGNFACAMALFGKLLGFPSVVAVSSKLTSEKRDFLRYLGCAIHQVGDFTIQGNEFCRQLANATPDQYCFLDQLHNWRNPRAHYESTGPEILADFPDVKMVVGSLGSGGSMTGIAEYIKKFAPQVTVVVVESAPGSRIPGTGSFADGDYVTPFIRAGYSQGYFDRTARISEADAASTANLLLSQGLFCGLQTGGVVYAAMKCAVSAGSAGTVVALSGDTGWKNLDRLMTAVS